MKKPFIPENEIAKPPDAPITAAAIALFKFLAFADVDKSAPTDYDGFGEYYERNMILQQKFTTEAYLRHLYVIYELVPPEDRDAILPALEDEIRRHNEFIIRSTEILTGIAIQMTVLKEASGKSKQKMIDYQPILSNNLLLLFFDDNQNLMSELKEKKQLFLVNKESFYEFWKVWSGKLKTFVVGKKAENAYVGVSRMFHSFLMQTLTLRDFQSVHDEFVRSDELFVGVDAKTIRRVCVDPAPDEIKPLFDSPSLFSFAVTSLRKAQFLELPLEAIGEVSLAMNLIEEMFRLETGLPVDDVYLSHLFNFSILASKIPNLVSMARYMEHFLGMVPENTKVLSLSERLMKILPSFYKRILALAVALMTKGPR
jgi:hypothetical protein